MVLKGAQARKQKKINLVGRPERSLYVSFRNKNKVERSRVVEILENSHPDVESVFLPRQKLPKFVYVLCKGVGEKDSVKECLKKLNNEELGRLHVSNPKERKENPEEEKASPKNKIDPCCLLLEFIPKEVTNEILEQEFPEAEKINRFNKRRCYIHFSKPKDAMKARIRISKEKIAGHILKVKFNKLPVSAPVQSESDEESEETADVVDAEESNDSD